MKETQKEAIAFLSPTVQFVNSAKPLLNMTISLVVQIRADDKVQKKMEKMLMDENLCVGSVTKIKLNKIIMFYTHAPFCCVLPNRCSAQLTLLSNFQAI